MGYYTKYSLIIKEESTLKKIKGYEKILQGWDFVGYAIDLCGNTIESCKWYSHDDDMKAISLSNPTLLFVLYGEGEDGAMWVKYFHNGKMQAESANISYKKYDRKKLT